MRKASELLRVSPAALSKSMKLLEDELGLKLLSRSGRGILITDEGRHLARRGGALLEDIEKLRSEIETRKEPCRELRIATFEVFSTYFLKALELLDSDDYDLTLYEVVPGELERAIVDGKADVGISYMPVPMPELDYIKVGSAEMGVFTSKTGFPGVDQRELPFVVPVMPISGAPSRVRGLDGWPDDAYPRKVRYQVTLMESALELCRQGRCAGYFPTFVVELHNQQVKDEHRLVRRASPYRGRTCYTDVYIVKRKTDLENPVIRKLAKAVRKVCN